MIINVRVIPNSSMNKIVEQKGDEWKIKLMTPPIDGRANESLIKFLADELKVKKNQIEILKGQTSRNKLIKISPK